MSHELAYFLKVNVAIALFYAFYRLFFYKDTFFKWRRIALLCFFAISIFYPLLNIQGWVKEQESMVVMADLYSTVILPEITIGAETEAPETNWKFLILSSINYIYWGVVCLLLIRFFIQLYEITRLAFRTRTAISHNTPVHLLNKPQGPFSFFKWIFIYPEAHTEEEIKEILTHERTHARQWHSVDVLFSEFMCIFCWFNPFIWLMRREVRNNLEFLADHKVLETGYDCKAYQYHLLGLTYEKKVATLYNSFNVLPLKIRIRMMNKKRTKQIERTKYLIFLPLAALLLIVSNIEAIARSTEKLIDHVVQPAIQTEMQETAFDLAEIILPPVETPDNPAQAVQQEKRYTYKGVVVDSNNKPIEGAKIVIDEPNAPQPVTNKKGEFSFEWGDKVRFFLFYEIDKKGIAQAISSSSDSKDRENMRITLDEKIARVIQVIPEVSENDSTVFEIVEEMPQFPGGNSELMQFLSKNIRYPQEAFKNNIQGRVIAQFIVGKDGVVREPTVVRSVSPELDAEAMRVVTTMPNWIPGKQRGKAVAVKYTVPIMFRLNQEMKPVDKIPESVVVGYGTSPRLDENETIYEIVEEMPKYPGGVESLMRYISQSIKYPVDAQMEGVQGNVMIQFIVDKNGNVKHPRIIRSVHPSLDLEAVRLVNNMLKWEPGKVKGEAVSVKYTIPIVFKLQQ